MNDLGYNGLTEQILSEQLTDIIENCVSKRNGAFEQCGRTCQI